ncbi:MAG: sugar phosphate isomerase/epimerase [Planctomycetes bacterium]|nr:sugar phosphate isomerase/epimerase [Planctomycetota bacterium]
MERLRLVSTVGWGFPSWREGEEAALLREFSVRHVQIFRNREKTITADEIRDGLAHEGLAIVALHAFFGDDWDPSNPDEAVRRTTVEKFAGEAEFCRTMGGNLVIVHPGHGTIGAETGNPARIEALRRSAARLAEIGSVYNCRFALENLPRGQMGDDPLMLRRIADEVDSPYLGLNFDCGHANLGAGVAKVLDIFGDRMIGTHIHDNNGQNDDHFVPGFGNINMEALCRGLARIGYRDDFTLELMGTTGEIRKTCTPEWWKKFNAWLALTNGNES